MLDRKINTQALIDILLIFLLSLTYAGISSGIFFGIRVVDILILIGVVYKFRSKIGLPVWIMVGLWLISLIISTIIGKVDEAPYLISDLRFFLVFVLGVLLAISLGKNIKVNLEIVFYALIASTLVIYLFIPFVPQMRFYYIPESYQSEEHLNTIFGPSVVLINYLFIYLVFQNRNRKFYFYLTYIFATILIYTLRISRQDLVIMFLLLMWSLGYRFIFNIKLSYLLLIGITCLGSFVFIIQTENERVKGILNPAKDTSFNYRVISNADFLKQFNNAPIVNKTFGFGMGSTFIFHYNEFLGRRELNILDNTPLTIMLKTGYVGLIIFIFILFYPMKYLNWHQRIVLFFPIVLSMFLFNHAMYNVLYIFGVYFISFRLKEEKKIKVKSLEI